ncbi:MAG: M28 family peptidase [Phycisphaerales bacterium]|nr:M28 family peptidase [Phycisphaerales bacterium]
MRRTQGWVLASLLLNGWVPGVLARPSQPETDDLRAARLERRLVEQERAAQQAAVVAELATTFQRHVNWLADPQRQGRAPGTAGIDEAADSIEDALLALGLEPAFEHAAPVEGLVPRSPYRQVLVVGQQVDALQSHVSFALPTGQVLVVPDAVVSATSGSAAFSGPCTFAGYAIVTGGGNYLGFAGAEDFSGRAVLMFSHEPMDELGRSLWADRGWSFAAPLHRKINAVTRRGARAVLVITPPDLDELASPSPDPVREQIEPFEVPVVHLPGPIADTVLRAGDAQGRGLHEFFRLANRQGVVANLEGVTTVVQTSVQARTLTSDNVGAVLPGRGALAGEFIVIGAHYDHLGRRQAGESGPGTAGERQEGQIHPGADDNASGVAGLLLCAELLSSRYDHLPADQPARSILFLAFTAEEMGRRGSIHYVEHPVAPIGQHALMLNMDMIGCVAASGLEIGGVESGEGLARLIEQRVIESGLEARPLESIGLDRSDQASFLDKGVPSLFFCTGLHEAYHTPYDTPDLIDAEGGSRVAQLVADIAFDAATAADRPAWTGRTRGQARDQTRDQRAKVRSGLVPSAGSSSRGMLISRVVDGSPAAAAGLQPGDRITSWNGTPVTGPDDWMPLLLDSRPGDVVPIEFTRAGQTHRGQITLEAVREKE